MVSICFIELWESASDSDGHKLLLLNVAEIASCEKEAGDDTTITMRDGRTYVVEESIKTIVARMRSASRGGD